MSEIIGQGGEAPAVAARAKAILVTPKEEWPKIATETDSVQSVFTRYVVPLAAIGPICGFIGGQVFGHSVLGITWRPSFIGGLSTAITSYVLALLSIFVVAWVANFLAGKFGGQDGFPRAFKLCAYAFTAAYVAGVFQLIPSLAILAVIAALYGIYLFYLGATPMMAVPQEKAGGYTAVTIIGVIVVYIVVGVITGAVTGIFGGGAINHVADAGKVSGTLSIPGVGSIDTAKIQQATDQMQKVANGEIKPLTAEQMSPLLPKQIGSYAQVSTSSTGLGSMGSETDAKYQAGDRSFELKVTDMAALGGLTGMAAAMGVEHSQQDANGYERVHKVGDQMVSEKWDNSDSSGSYGVSIANRFYVEADGNAASIDELKAAVAAVDPGKLVGLAG